MSSRIRGSQPALCVVCDQPAQGGVRCNFETGECWSVHWASLLGQGETLCSLQPAQAFFMGMRMQATLDEYDRSTTETRYGFG